MDKKLITLLLEKNNVEASQIIELVSYLSEEVQEDALKILLNCHTYGFIKKAFDDNTESKVLLGKLEDKIGIKYTKPLKIVSVDLLNNEIEYEYEFIQFPYAYFKTQEAADLDSEDRSEKKTNEYNVLKEYKFMGRNHIRNEFCTCEEWIEFNRSYIKSL